MERFGDPGGRPLLFFHGLPGSRLDLLHEEPLFASHGLEVIAIDRPGFGLTPRRRGRTMLGWAEDVRAIAERLGLDRFPVVGYSSGGRYAVACASALPDRVTLAAVIAGTGPPEMPGFRQNLTPIDRVSLALANRLPTAVEALWQPTRWLAAKHPLRLAAVLRSGVSDPDRRYLTDPGTRDPLMRSIAEGLREGVGGVADEYAIEARPWGFALEGIEVPVRIWHGDEDRIVGPAHSVYLAGRIPGARLEILRGVGHMLGDRIGPIAGVIAAEG